MELELSKDIKEAKFRRLRLNQVEDAEIVGGGFANCPYCGSRKLKERIELNDNHHWYCYSCDTEFDKAIFTKK